MNSLKNDFSFVELKLPSQIREIIKMNIGRDQRNKDAKESSWGFDFEPFPKGIFILRQFNTTMSSRSQKYLKPLDLV